ncbi:MauE/DoxX family redox-associated membrane protein [Microbacterium shaanxiense]
MNALVVVLIALLVLVLFASAFGKVHATDRGQAAFAALRIPMSQPRVAALALIAAESAIALWLTLASGWALAIGAWLATAFMSALLAVVVRAHRLGSTEDCGCFGDWLPSRIGASLIGRNLSLVIAAVVLSILSTFAAAEGRRAGVTPLFSPAAEDAAVYWALAACAITAIVIGTAVRALSRASTEPSPLVEPTSSVVLLPDSGDIVDLAKPGTRARLIVFLRAGCRACIAVHELLAMEGGALSAVVDVYVVYSLPQGNLDNVDALSAPTGAALAVDLAGSLGSRLEVGVRRPAAALVVPTGNGTVPVALGTDGISALVSSLVAVAEGAEMR